MLLKGMQHDLVETVGEHEAADDGLNVGQRLMGNLTLLRTEKEVI